MGKRQNPHRSIQSTVVGLALIAVICASGASHAQGDLTSFFSSWFGDDEPTTSVHEAALEDTNSWWCLWCSEEKSAQPEPAPAPIQVDEQLVPSCIVQQNTDTTSISLKSGDVVTFTAQESPIFVVYSCGKITVGPDTLSSIGTSALTSVDRSMVFEHTKTGGIQVSAQSAGDGNEAVTIEEFGVLFFELKPVTETVQTTSLPSVPFMNVTNITRKEACTHPEIYTWIDCTEEQNAVNILNVLPPSTSFVQFWYPWMLLPIQQIFTSPLSTPLKVDDSLRTSTPYTTPPMTTTVTTAPPINTKPVVSTQPIINPSSLPPVLPLSTTTTGGGASTSSSSSSSTSASHHAARVMLPSCTNGRDDVDGDGASDESDSGCDPDEFTASDLPLSEFRDLLFTQGKLSKSDLSPNASIVSDCSNTMDDDLNSMSDIDDAKCRNGTGERSTNSYHSAPSPNPTPTSVQTTIY